MSDLVIARGRLAVDTSVATATDFFATALPASRACVMRISVCVATATRIDARVFDGTATAAQQLNGGNNLDAEALRVFYVPLRPGDTLNLRHSDAGAVVVRYCLVDELQGPVPAPDPVSNETMIAVGPGGLGKTEDSAHVTADVGVEMLAVRRDAAASSTATDGDYATVNTDATGNVWTRIGPELPAGTQNIGDVDVVSVVPGTGATNLGKAEDAVHGSGDVGVMALAVRVDAAAAQGGAGDYVPILTDASGRLHIGPAPANSGVDIGDVDVSSVTAGTGAAHLGKAEDAVAGDGDTGVMVLSVRRDAAASSAGASGDYATMNTDANGRVYAAANLEIGGAAAPGGAGAVTAATPRATLASDDPAVTALQIMDDWDETNRAAVNPISGQVGVTGGSGVVGAAVQRVVLATDVGLPAGANNIGDVDVLTVPAPLSSTGGGTEAAALRVTLANDSTGLVSVDDNAGSLTVDNAALSVVGGGVEAGSLRVTLANDSTGLVSIDDNGGSLTVDNPDIGLVADAAATVGSTGSLSAKLRLITSQLDAIQTSVQLLDNAVAGNAFRVGGYTAHVARDVAIQSAAYAAEDAYGAAFVFSQVTRSAGLGCVLKSFQFVDENDVKPELHLFLLDRSIASGPADNASMSAGAAASWGAVERDVIQGPFSILSSDWENIDGSNAVARIDLAHAMKAPNSGRDYGARLKTGTAVGSAGATRNVRVTVEVLQD